MWALRYEMPGFYLKFRSDYPWVTANGNLRLVIKREWFTRLLGVSVLSEGI